MAMLRQCLIASFDLNSTTRLRASRSGKTVVSSMPHVSKDLLISLTAQLGIVIFVKLSNWRGESASE